MASDRKLVSIVVPCFNEGEAVDLLYRALDDACARAEGADFEFILVDDGSSDDTLARLLELVARDKRVRVIELSRNFGKEAALSAGLDAAQGDAAIPLDADLQDPPELIPALIAEWQNGAEVVLVHRADRSSDSFLKRHTAAIFYRLHNWLSPVKIPENVGEFRLIDRIVLEAVKQLPERQRFMKGLFAWVGFKTAVVDCERPSRERGDSKFTAREMWNHAINGLTSFSTAPLRLCTYIGLITALATILYAGFVVLRTLIHGIDVPGYASLLVAILFFGSLQLIGLGLLGEYVGRTYLETKGRPRYVVRRTHQAPQAK